MNTSEYNSPSRRLARLALVALTLLPVTAHANDPFWTYLLRPGDTLWRFANTHLVSTAYVPRLSALNNIRNPDRIDVATKIRVPYEWVRQQAAAAQVSHISGHASITLPGTESRPLQVNEQVPESAELTTQGESRIVLRFLDGSELTVGSNSQIRIENQRYYPSTGASDTRLRLERGTATNVVSKPSLMRNRFEIDTPSATTSVRGTRFRVGVATDESTSTAVLEGKVAVGSESQSEDLSPGQGTVVAKHQGTPLTAETLLPPPSLASLPARLDYTPPLFSWPAVAGASGYHAEIFRDDATGTLVSEANTTRPAFAPVGLLDGSYRLRVRSRAASSLEGSDAEHRFVLSASPRPPLRIGADLDSFRGRTLALRTSDDGQGRTQLVQLSDSADFAQGTVLEYSISENDLGSIELPRYGRWYWRVARLDDVARPGPFSSPQAIEAVAWFERVDRHGPNQIIAPKAALPGVRYRLELAESADFAHVLFRRDSDSPRWRPDRLPSGRYWARVSVLGDNDYHSESPPESLFWN